MICGVLVDVAGVGCSRVLFVDSPVFLICHLVGLLVLSVYCYGGECVEGCLCMV